MEGLPQNAKGRKRQGEATGLLLQRQRESIIKVSLLETERRKRPPFLNSNFRNLAMRFGLHFNKPARKKSETQSKPVAK